MVKNISKIFFVFFYLFLFGGLINSALADTWDCTCLDGTKSVEASCQDCALKCQGDPAACTPTLTSQPTNSSCPEGVVCLPNPLKTNSPQVLIGRIINSILGIIGSLALVMFIFGGLTWMTSSGSPEKVKKGRDTILWSAIGLIIIFAAYAAVRFLLVSLQ